jgi:hypothetical protein
MKETASKRRTERILGPVSTRLPQRVLVAQNKGPSEEAMRL